jgi:hypothetical protein
MTYVCKTLAAIEAHSLEAAVSKHLDHLGIFLAVLLEGKLTTLVVVLLGTPSPVLSSLLHDVSASSPNSVTRLPPPL